jgi:hypothetical protein
MKRNPALLDGISQRRFLVPGAILMRTTASRGMDSSSAAIAHDRSCEARPILRHRGGAAGPTGNGAGSPAMAGEHRA